MAREEEGVIKATKLGGNGVRNFLASRTSPPERCRRPTNRPRELGRSLALEKQRRGAFPGRQERQ
jgi:hypothetical protein